MLRAFLLLIVLVLAAMPAFAGHPDHEEPTRTLYLIRHGEYEHGVETPDEGALVTLGRQQARLIATRLVSMPVAFTSIQASTMHRARETGEIVATRFPQLVLQTHDDLRECTPPTRRADIMVDLEPGEAEACQEQLAAAWERLARPASGPVDEHDIVVCHGNVIRWFVCRALEVDPVAWLGMSIANCSLTVIQIRGDGSAKVVSFADSGHVPWEMTTYPGTPAPQ